MRQSSKSGVVARHRSGFALVIPWHIALCPEELRPLILGRLRVVGVARKKMGLSGIRIDAGEQKTLSLDGDVPASWLVDLNAAPVLFEVAA